MKTLIKILICLLSFNGFTQIAPLEDHAWYLEKLVISGSDVFPTQNLQPYNDFNYNQTYNFLLKSCWDINGELTYNDANHEFSIIDSVLIPNECPNIPNSDMFDTTYISEFYDFNNDHPDPFSYTFTTQPNYIVLTVTNTNGDQAIYRNQQVAVVSKEKVAIHLYPKPVTERFQLEIETGKEIKTVRIFSVNGKEVLSFIEV